MKLVTHAGHCCGIKCIYSLDYTPDALLPPLRKKKFNDGDATGHSRGGEWFFTDSAPRESYLERLDRYLAFCDKHRPDGIVEVILANNKGQGYVPNQYMKWKEHLIKRGFKEVNSCLNSNSGNNIYVFHRNSGEI